MENAGPRPESYKGTVLARFVVLGAAAVGPACLADGSTEPSVVEQGETRRVSSDATPFPRDPLDSPAVGGKPGQSQTNVGESPATTEM